ncbi:lysine-specific demethylase 4 [Colletotrichum liriopes]|uniref:Lysine-specific demethylase 4 n=1 Tax=Colletotrichum liriopes TaxID=708192 RepID=A0AA37H1M4_9PEZI|nr:lysine-specific demethylase 4 [Colletotrichum liriopes]
MVCSGLKLWVVIPAHYTAPFEEFVKQHWRTNNCAQFVRHLSLFIGPTTLREAGIEFNVHCAGPGDMIVTNPGQYHMVANFSDCFAMSINFLLPGETVIPEDLAPKKRAVLRQAAGPLRLGKKQNRALMPSSVNPELVEVEEQIKKVDPLCRIPSFSGQPPSYEVFKLAAVIYSRLAIRQFCSLVHSRRGLDTEN